MSSTSRSIHTGGGTRSGSNRPPQVCVYAAIDVSRSMAGSKLREVCSSIHDILNSVPDDVLFDVSLFSATAWKVATALKSALNPARLTQEIQDACGTQGGTALYDAWGDLLMSIPDAVWRKEIVQICILTDGEDNASTRYDHASVMQLMNEKMTPRTTFNFIHVGKGGNEQVVQSLKTICNATQGRIQTQHVDDNATGIKTAMKSVRNDIMLSTRNGPSMNTPSPKTGIKLVRGPESTQSVRVANKPTGPSSLKPQVQYSLNPTQSAKSNHVVSTASKTVPALKTAAFPSSTKNPTMSFKLG